MAETIAEFNAADASRQVGCFDTRIKESNNDLLHVNLVTATVGEAGARVIAGSKGVHVEGFEYLFALRGVLSLSSPDWKNEEDSFQGTWGNTDSQIGIRSLTDDEIVSRAAFIESSDMPTGQAWLHIGDLQDDIRKKLDEAGVGEKYAEFYYGRNDALLRLERQRLYQSTRDLRPSINVRSFTRYLFPDHSMGGETLRHITGANEMLEALQQKEGLVQDVARVNAALDSIQVLPSALSRIANISITNPVADAVLGRLQRDASNPTVVAALEQARANSMAEGERAEEQLCRVAGQLGHVSMLYIPASAANDADRRRHIQQGIDLLNELHSAETAQQS